MAYQQLYYAPKGTFRGNLQMSDHFLVLLLATNDLITFGGSFQIAVVMSRFHV